MTSRRYRFSLTVGTMDYFSETSACLDGAIEEARRQSKENDGVRIYVTDTESQPHVVRGYAISGAWTWCLRCRTCNGNGVVPGKTKAGKSVNDACSACNGSGARV